MSKPSPTAELALDPEVRAELEKLGTPKSFASHAIIFAEGDKPRGVYIIHAGKVELSLHGDNGELISRRVVGADGIIGLPSTLGNKNYSLTAEALEAVRTVFVPRQDLLEFLRQNPAVCLQLLGTLSTEVRTMRNLMAHPRSKGN